MKKTFGFIVLRHVNSESTDVLWQQCCRCIRKIYNNPIIIIDDNSNKNIVSKNTFDNCSVIESEFPKRGEILAYYYFLKLKPFDKAIILHDSIYFNSPLDFSLITQCKFLWNFKHDWDNPQFEKSMINELKIPNETKNNLLELYESKDQWNGCFGAMSVISYDFLSNMESRYCFIKSLLPYVKERLTRMTFERIFGLLCISYLREIKHFENRKTMFGDIHRFIQLNYEPWGHYGWSGFFYPSYIKHDYNIKTPIVKVWCQR